MPLSQELLQLLACPRCRGALAQAGDAFLVCAACALKYPVQDGIPVLLVDRAQPLSGDR